MGCCMPAQDFFKHLDILIFVEGKLPRDWGTPQTALLAVYLAVLCGNEQASGSACLAVHRHLSQQARRRVAGLRPSPGTIYAMDEENEVLAARGFADQHVFSGEQVLLSVLKSRGLLSAALEAQLREARLPYLSSSPAALAGCGVTSYAFLPGQGVLEERAAALRSHAARHAGPRRSLRP